MSWPIVLLSQLLDGDEISSCIHPIEQKGNVGMIKSILHKVNETDWFGREFFYVLQGQIQLNKRKQNISDEMKQKEGDFYSPSLVLQGLTNSPQKLQKDRRIKCLKCRYIGNARGEDLNPRRFWVKKFEYYHMPPEGWGPHVHQPKSEER